ncbi:MAG: hypothetical protein LUG12_02415 [Erysipelotrichaceae bacterium]|nr:hypothetical protein [Erysipelotrichaceae bacterium]
MKGIYDIYVQGFDYGCGVSKVLVTLQSEIDCVLKENLKIIETRQAADMTKPDFPVEIISCERHIEDAYLSNEKGERINKASSYVMIELRCSPMEGNPLVFDMHTQYNTYSDPYTLEITYNDEWCIDECYRHRYTCADAFTLDCYSDGEVTFQYAYYQPARHSSSLIVWLHGLGEGGIINTDPYICLLANKVTALISDEFQNMFAGVHVLVPQCPTYWMDIDGQCSNFFGGKIQGKRESYYTSSLHALIDDYKKKNHIDNVILCGCSNGGYMTLLMGMDYSHEYKAIVPICEAMPDLYISDEDIVNLKDLPMYFVYSLDDDIVDPTLHEIPTIKRLRKIGASDLHVSVSEHVIDRSGQYFDENHQPYQYMGHWSWVYFDNNECVSEDNMKAWEFMASRMLR